MKTGEALLIVGALGAGAYLLTQRDGQAGGGTTILPAPDGGGYPDIVFPEWPKFDFPEWPKFDFPEWPKYEPPVIPELPDISPDGGGGGLQIVFPGAPGELPTYAGIGYMDYLGLTWEELVAKFPGAYIKGADVGVEVGLPSGGALPDFNADWLAGLISTEQYLGFLDAGKLTPVEGGGFSLPDVGGIAGELTGIIPEFPSFEIPEFPGWPEMPEFPGWPEMPAIPDVTLPSVPTIPAAGGIGEGIGGWLAGGVESLVGGVITGVWDVGAEERAGYAAFAEAATAPSGLTDIETWMPVMRIVDGIEAMANTIAGGGALGGVSPGPGTRETGLEEAAAIMEGMAAGELDTWGMPIISAATKPGGTASDAQGEVWTPTIDPSVPEQWRIL